MGMWIRSQDKTALAKVEILTINKNDFTYDIEECITLGKYKTKERAVEILDEIQKNLIKQGQLFIKTNEYGIPTGNECYGYVYEMPEE